MKREKLLQALIVFCIVPFLFGLVRTPESFVTINNISFEHNPLCTRIVFSADSPLSMPNSYYSKEQPSTIVVNFDQAQTSGKSLLNVQKPSLIKDLKIEDGDSNKLSFLISLKEKVPYRIYSTKEQTVLELNAIQNAQGEYVLSSQIKNKINNSEIPPVYLKDVEVSENPNTVNVTAKLTGEALPQVFALDNPLRLVVDLHNTLDSRPPSVHPVNKYGLDKVRVAQFQISNPYTITRMVFDISEAKYYSLASDRDELTISFHKDQPEVAASLPGTSSVEMASSKTPEKPAQQETEKTSPPKEKPASPAIANTPDDLQPQSVERNGSAQKEAQEEQYKPKSLIEAEEKYSGELISLKFKDADLRDVILYLGEFAQLNVVFDPEVRGTVTADLEDVPWDQALDIILKINKTGKTIEGNVLRIAPLGVLTREQQDERKMKESKELSGPILVKTFTLSYSKSQDVKTLLQTKISERGEMIVDDRTNTLIISEVKDRMDLLEKLISVLDTATPQVSIEARIVEATSTFIRNLGIQWGFRGIADPFYGNQTSLQFPNKVLADGAMIPQGIVTKGIGGPLGGYAVNLPAPAFSTAIGLSLGNVLNTFRLDMALSALETSGSGRIISSPSVTTQNNKEAEIIQGRQIPVQTVANFTVTTRYVNAALELRATPQITAEGTIIMFIEIRNNAADFANLVNGIPPITTQSAKTVVMIPDGGTTVIGGIYRTEDSITHERVPFFHKIPILGNLFRSFARTKQNRELLIFITPRIIK